MARMSRMMRSIGCDRKNPGPPITVAAKSMLADMTPDLRVAVIDTFNVSNISTTPQVLTSEAIEQAVLSSGSTYWIVGGTTQGQVNWNLADGVFDPYAYRVGDGDWIYDDYGNVSAFAIHGTAIPEPGTILLLGLGGLMLRRRRKA